MRYLLVCLLGLFILDVPEASHAQLNRTSIDCQSDRARPDGLRLGSTYVAPCDSMLVLNKPTYVRLDLEARQQREIVSRTEDANRMLVGISSTQDSIITAQRREIEAFERYHETAERTNQELLEKLNQSIANTDEAIGIARRNWRRGLLAGGGAGIVVGLLVGVLAF